MRITRIMAVPLIGVLLILGACGPAPSLTQTPPAPTTPGTGPAAFTTSALTITPRTAKPGEPVEVGVMVTNTGGQQGTYTVVMKLHDGTIVKTQDVTLAGGAKQKVTLNMSMNSVGTYMIMIDELAGSLVVQDAAAPAPTQPAPTPGAGPAAFTDGAFTISNLGLDPEMPEPGDDVTVSFKVTNTGGQQGTYTVVVKMDGVTAKTQSITLAGGDSQAVNLTIKAPSKEGTFIITVGQLTAKMVVMGM